MILENDFSPDMHVFFYIWFVKNQENCRAKETEKKAPKHCKRSAKKRVIYAKFSGQGGL